MINTPLPQNYNIAVPNTAKENYSDEYITAQPIGNCFCDENLNSSYDLFLHGLKRNNGQNSCIGYRVRCKNGELSNYFEFRSYAKINQFVLKLGSALSQIGAVEEITYEDESYKLAQKLKCVAIFMKNRLEWFITELACAAYGYTLVPLYETFTSDYLQYILSTTKLTTIVTTEALFPVIIPIIHETNVKIIIYVSEYGSSAAETKKNIETLKSKNVICYKLQTVINNCKEIYPASPSCSDAVNTICYTSGTTSMPKGVLLTNKNIVGCVKMIIDGPLSYDLKLTEKDLTISYLPLVHVLERLVCNIVFYVGASIGVYSGDAKTLLEDVTTLNPTIFVTVPRLLNRINSNITKKVASKSLFEKFLFYKGAQKKLDKLHESAQCKSWFWDTVVFSKTKSLLGNRLRYIICGGAPLDATVQENIKIYLGVPVLEGYGMTETFGALFLSSPQDSLAGHVGGVFPYAKFRLKSVPELNYYVTSDPPCGELQLKGDSVTKGYFRNIKETDALFDEPEWLATGDVATLLPRNAVKIIDRKKNIYKLAQGEYIIPDKIENVYSQLPIISNIFVHGDSTRHFVVGIIVPDEAKVLEWAEEQDMANLAYVKVLEEPSFIEYITKEVLEFGKSSTLASFERIKCFHIEEEPFSTENGLLTSTFKLKRQAAQKKYQTILANLYRQFGED